MKIADIRIGERVRKDMGDIQALADSISEHGLLHPVVITPEGTLVCGARRIEAARLLGWSEIPVREMSIDDLLSAERDENTVRKDFRPTEAVAIGRLIEEQERASRPSRSEQVKASWEVRRAKKNGTGNLRVPSTHRGNVSDVAAKAVGMAPSTYGHAKVVIDSAEEEPDRYGDLPAKMDELGAVAPVYDELRRRRNGGTKSDIVPRTRTVKSRRSVAQRARHAIGVISSMSSEFDDFTLDQVSPTDDERQSWERELRSAIASLNRFRKELKGAKKR